MCENVVYFRTRFIIFLLPYIEMLGILIYNGLTCESIVTA